MQSLLSQHPASLLDNGTYAAVRPGMRAANSVVLFGDSITANCLKVNGVNTYYSTQGFWTWANALGLAHRLKMVANAGVSGNTTTQMLARVQADVVALAPGWAVVEGGINDVKASVATGTIEANLLAIFDALDVANIRVVATTVTPYDTATSAQLAQILALNQWLKGLARSRPNFVLIDTYTPVADATTGGWASVMTSDGTHPSSRGAARMGRACALVLAPLIPFVDSLLETSADTLNLMANGMMNGSGGSLANSITGTVATSWNAHSTNGSATTGAATVVARTDQMPGNWQQLQVTSNNIELYQDVTVGFAVGDTIQGACEFEVDGDVVSPLQLRLAVVCADSGFSALAVAYDFFIESDGINAENLPRRGIFRTPSIVIPANTAHLQLRANIDIGTIRVGRCDLRKVA